jgi:hypothetical protein
LAIGQRHGGRAFDRAVLASRVTLATIWSDVSEDKFHIGHVAHIDRPPVARGQQQIGDLGRCGQRLARDKVDLFALVAHIAGGEGPVGGLLTLPASCCSVTP